MQVNIRRTEQRDIPELVNLWHKVFGDSPARILSFFSRFYPERCALVAEESGKIAASMYVLDVGELCIAENSLPVGVTYAVGTLPEYRGRGYGKMLTRAGIEASFLKGMEVNIICPAEDSLFEYYKSVLNCRDWFYACEYRLRKSELSAEKCALSLSRVNAREYSCLREQRLEGTHHVAFNENALEYQHELCEKSGGGMFRIDGGEAGCMAAEIAEDGTVFVKELLFAQEEASAAVSALAQELQAEELVIRTPAKNVEDANVRRFALLATESGEMPSAHSEYLPWYGFAFD